MNELNLSSSSSIDIKAHGTAMKIRKIVSYILQGTFPRKIYILTDTNNIGNVIVLIKDEILIINNTRSVLPLVRRLSIFLLRRNNKVKKCIFNAEFKTPG